MVAFAFKHDPVFARHFLKSVCKAKRYSSPRSYEALFQLQHCADLVIRAIDRSELFVIEFKIDALLQPKQNPLTPQFFRTGGYGAQILKKPEWCHFKKRTYVVLQHNRLFEQDGRLKGLNYHACSWSQLAPGHMAPKGIFTDLLKSLSEIGIPSLKNWKGETMKIGDHTKDAVNMWELLSGVLGKAQLSTRPAWNIGHDEEQSWFGLNWPAKAPGYQELVSVVKPSGAAGWFGYRRVNKNAPEVAICCYCDGDEGSLERTKKWLRKRLPPAISKSIHQEEDELYVTTAAKNAEHDEAWLTAVFEKLKD